MNFNRKRIGGRRLQYRSHEEVPRRLSITQQKITDLGHTADRGLPRRWAAIGRLVNPIVRFLHRQIGRPWAEVEKELDARCRRLRAPAELRALARAQVFDSVAPTDYWLHATPQKNFRCYLAPGWLYVDPESGRLCRHGPAR